MHAGFLKASSFEECWEEMLAGGCKYTLGDDVLLQSYI